MAFIHSINGVPAKLRIAEDIPPAQLLFGEDIPVNRQERIWLLCIAALCSALLVGALAAYAWGHLA